MALRSITTSLAFAISLLYLSLLQSATYVDAKKNEPTVFSTDFDHPLQNLFYFEDSDVIIGHDREAASVWRSIDAGKTWEVIDDDGQKNAVWDVWPHAWDNNKAYILGLEYRHWKTNDRGKTWVAFETPGTPSLFREPFSFHGQDSNKIIFHAQVCEGWVCDEKTYFTLDDFETTELLRDNARGCLWAVSTPMFGEDLDIGSIIQDRIFCIIRGDWSPWPKDNRFVLSDNFFLEEKEVVMSSGRTVSGLINTAPVKSYIVAAAMAEGTDELVLFVSHDASTWHRAEFGTHKVEQGAYTLLESTNYSMQVDVMTTKPTSAMGVLFTSNSNGTYFTRNIEHTNRGINGMVDFEKMTGIQGIYLVNTVENWEYVEETNLQNKEVVSSISFDDGRTFQNLKVGDKRLHLHSVSDISNSGRVFSSPAPGLVMGIGNTGDFLGSYDEGNLYVSDDAGETWKLALKGSHKYEFGDQGSVLVAVADGRETDTIQYSINHGKDWEEVDLGAKVSAKVLTTTSDSTSLKFVLEALGTGEEGIWKVFSIDFEGLHEKKCGNSDFEKWPARVDDKGKPSCLMGHKQFYRRRKPNADCFVDEEFKDPQPEFEPCECTKADFECDTNFVRSEDREECVQAGELIIPDGQCQNLNDKFKGSSGWRLIPGNDCKRKGGKQLDDPVERKCSESGKKPASGNIEVEKTFFDSETLPEYYYLERSDYSSRTDETILMRTKQGQIYRSQDHGKTWAPILEDERILAIMPHAYFNDVVFFLTESETVFYSIDRAETFDSFEAPDPPNQQGLIPLAFHPDYKDWIIWTGAQKCPGTNCHSVAHYSTDRGDNWNTLLRYVKKCEFIHDPDQGQNPEGHNKKLVYCEQYENENPSGTLQLLSSTTWFAEKEVHFDNILDFAVMSEFIIVAARAEDQKTLKVDASVDGSTFADAQFPPNFQVDHQQAYTVLDSSTHAVFLHVTVNNALDHEYGTIIKSNSNGTSYSLSLNAVNRDTNGYVDFEKMQGLEGVATVNVAFNSDKVDKGEDKRLKSMITHNDGAEWAYISPPTKDSDGKNFQCSAASGGKALERCSLHIHSYTERANKAATFGSASAVGIMMAVGNVGEFLKPKSDDSTHTFITRDGGISWQAIKKGSYMWEYGDQGSVIVIVREYEPTKSVFYTLDEGQTWQEFEFSDVPMEVDFISTVPSDNSFKFLVWGYQEGKSGFVTVHLDFSGLKERERECDLDETNPENDDYYFWSPKHPLQKDDCLFGHVAQYHRKRPEAECRNGRRIPQFHSSAGNCSCTRQDFECDYNYERMSDGSCKLVDGMMAPDHSLVCKDDPERVEFFAPTGYRRIPLTTCVSGLELDKDLIRPCPGREEEFSERHGISGVGLFFAITIPIAVAFGVGYWAWGEYQSGRFAGFGQIRLGEGPEQRENPFVAIPVNIIAGTWAIVQATPLLLMSLWRSARGYFPVSTSQPYRSRASFSTRRQDYSSVVADEDELFGEDDEDTEV